MKLVRLLLVLAGLAALAWGAVLFADFAFPLGPESFAALGWLLGGPIAHDALVAPAAGLAGLVLTRFAPRPWRVPLLVGAVLSAVLTLLAIPLLWRPFGVPVNPGLHDADTGAGLLVSLAAVWTVVLVTGLVRTLRSRVKPDEG
ncbi:hypothetical protein [Amycolatopsis anabasis]|uniref:hypothetical protein n=1 Tax=Amycolatopsis anabasis TaxID=1840409 RepID=UPI00131D433E|nr:hypothetical protein [Amycolatopsis anabasis]